MRKIKKRNGFTLIEILLALGLISLFIVSVFFIYRPITKQIVVDATIKNAAIFKVKADELLNGSQLLNVGSDGYNKVMLYCSSETEDAKACFDKYDLNELYNNRGGKYIEYDFTIRTTISNKEGSLTIYGIRDADTCVKIADNFAKNYGNVDINNPSGSYSYHDDEDEEQAEEQGDYTMKNLVNHCQGFNSYEDGEFFSYSISTDVLYKG